MTLAAKAYAIVQQNAKLLNVNDLDGTMGRWLVQQVATQYGVTQDVARKSVEYLEAFRTAEQGASLAAQMPIRVPATSPQDITRACQMVIPTIKKQISVGMVAEKAKQAVMNYLSQNMSQMVMNEGRGVIALSAAENRYSIGYRRVPDADPCEFCSILVSRGPAYRTAQSARRTASGKAFHNHCYCGVEEIFDYWEPDERDQRCIDEYNDAVEEIDGPVTKKTVLAQMKSSRMDLGASPGNMTKEELNAKKRERARLRREKAKLEDTKPVPLPKPAPLPVITPIDNDAALLLKRARARERARLRRERAKVPPPVTPPVVVPKPVQRYSPPKIVAHNKPLATDRLKLLMEKEPAGTIIRRTNPKLDHLSGAYRVNCQNVAATVEMRFRGYDVTAAPQFRRSFADIAEDWITPEGTNREWSPWGSIAKVKARVADWPEGSRGVVGLIWKGGKSAHILNVERTKLGVRFLDGQVKQSMSDISESRIRADGAMVLRVDDLDFIGDPDTYFETGVFKKRLD